MNKRKKVPEWVLREIRAWADAAWRTSKRPNNVDSTAIPSRHECAGRALMLDNLADHIERGCDE